MSALRDWAALIGAMAVAVWLGHVLWYYTLDWLP